MTDPIAPRRVALTFDAEHPDRPSRPGIDARLLETLDEFGLTASFFVQGRWAEAYPDLAARIPRAGHLVGSHSHYHARMPLFTDVALRTDIATAEEAIRHATGVDPRPWFRCPFGAGMDDPRVLRAIEAAGYRHVGWNVVGEDWDPERTPGDVGARVVDGVGRHGDGAVVLLHSWPDRMLDALPGIVRRLTGEGWAFVRVDALDHVPASGSSVDELAEAAPIGAHGVQP